MGKRVLQYQDEPVRAVRVVARRGNKIVAQTPVRHTQCPFDEPVISFQRRWLLKRDPSLANATFHLVSGVHVKRIEATKLTKPTSEPARVLDLTEPISKIQARDNGASLTIPNWIRGFRYSGWTNVFQLIPNNKHLYGTETLFGDWNSRVLLLAKDGAPTEVIRALRDKGESRPWRHAQRELGDPGGWRTNERLSSFASMIPETKLYGSATANMLYDDPRWSRSLPGFYDGPLNQFLQRVLIWVAESMPNLEHIGCLGNESWFLTCLTMGNFGAASNFQEYRDKRKPFEGRIGKKGLHAVPLYHPGARVSTTSMEHGWGAFAALTLRKETRGDRNGIQRNN
jgi:hypothetical protein